MHQAEPPVLTEEQCQTHGNLVAHRIEREDAPVEFSEPQTARPQIGTDPYAWRGEVERAIIFWIQQASYAQIVAIDIDRSPLVSSLYVVCSLEPELTKQPEILVRFPAVFDLLILNFPHYRSRRDRSAMGLDPSIL